MTAINYEMYTVTPERVVAIAEERGWTPTKGEAHAVAFWAELWLGDGAVDADTFDTVLSSILSGGRVVARFFLAAEMDRTVFGESMTFPAEGGFLHRALEGVIEALEPAMRNREPWLWRETIGDV